MTANVIEPVDLAPALPQVPVSTFARVDRTARTVVYWTLMAIGTVVPLGGGLYGLLRGL